MVEVFKTNVTSNHQAKQLVHLIEDYFDYKVNFDLEDCDHILRVEAYSEEVQPQPLINLLENMGVHAEVL